MVSKSYSTEKDSSVTDDLHKSHFTHPTVWSTSSKFYHSPTHLKTRYSGQLIYQSSPMENGGNPHPEETQWSWGECANQRAILKWGYWSHESAALVGVSLYPLCSFPLHWHGIECLKTGFPKIEELLKKNCNVVSTLHPGNCNFPGQHLWPMPHNQARESIIARWPCDTLCYWKLFSYQMHPAIIMFE